MSNEYYYDYRNPSEAFARQVLLNGKVNWPKKGRYSRILRYIKELMGTKVSLFTYDNIENAIPHMTSALLESIILTNDRLCLYYIAGTAEWVLGRYVGNSTMNYYNRPETVNISTLNGYDVATDVPYDDIILVKDNRLDIPPLLTIQEYMEKITNIEKRFDRVLKNATLPLALVGDKKAMAALKSIADASDDADKAYIAGSDTLVDAVKGFAIDMNVTPEDVYNLRMKYRNECLASLGIYALQEKSERLLTREITSMNEYADFQYQQALLCRQDFVDKFNAKSSVKIKLVETYDKNYLENSELAAKETKMLTEAGGGSNNAKPNPSTAN